MIWDLVLADDHQHTSGQSPSRKSEHGSLTKPAESARFLFQLLPAEEYIIEEVCSMREAVDLLISLVLAV